MFAYYFCGLPIVQRLVKVCVYNSQSEENLDLFFFYFHFSAHAAAFRSAVSVYTVIRWILVPFPYLVSTLLTLYKVKGVRQRLCTWHNSKTKFSHLTKPPISHPSMFHWLTNPDQILQEKPGQFLWSRPRPLKKTSDRTKTTKMWSVSPLNIISEWNFISWLIIKNHVSCALIGRLQFITVVTLTLLIFVAVLSFFEKFSKYKNVGKAKWKREVKSQCNYVFHNFENQCF